MDVHLSLGVTTLVALMAADRGNRKPASPTEADNFQTDRVAGAVSEPVKRTIGKMPPLRSAPRGFR
jgi:hypothetical protein